MTLLPTLHYKFNIITKVAIIKPGAYTVEGEKIN